MPARRVSPTLPTVSLASAYFVVSAAAMTAPGPLLAATCSVPPFGSTTAVVSVAAGSVPATVVAAGSTGAAAPPSSVTVAPDAVDAVPAEFEDDEPEVVLDPVDADVVLDDFVVFDAVFVVDWELPDELFVVCVFVVGLFVVDLVVVRFVVWDFEGLVVPELCCVVPWLWVVVCVVCVLPELVGAAVEVGAVVGAAVAVGVGVFWSLTHWSYVLMRDHSVHFAVSRTWPSASL